jgi:hypothetical protein
MRAPAILMRYGQSSCHRVNGAAVPIGLIGPQLDGIGTASRLPARRRRRKRYWVVCAPPTGSCSPLRSYERKTSVRARAFIPLPLAHWALSGGSAVREAAPGVLNRRCPLSTTISRRPWKPGSSLSLTTSR